MNILTPTGLLKVVTPNNEPYTYPRRGLDIESRKVLLIALQSTEADLNYVCRSGNQGFKVSLHTPGEIPNIS